LSSPWAAAGFPSSLVTTSIRALLLSLTRILPPVCWRASSKPIYSSFPQQWKKLPSILANPGRSGLITMMLAEAKQYLAEGTHFAKGSMAPKIQAIIWYLENGGTEALITNPENIGRALKGETGTWIVK
jgi:hypothetical protein